MDNNNIESSLSVCTTKFSHDNTAHDEERSEELKVGDISLEDELVDAGRDHSSEAAEDIYPGLSLFESFIVLLRQLSYAIKNQLVASKAPY